MFLSTSFSYPSYDPTVKNTKKLQSIVCVPKLFGIF